MPPPSLLCACSVSELLAGLSSGVFSAEQILNSCLGRIRLRDAEVKAWAYLDSDNGFAANKVLSRKNKNEKLRGIPFAVKDVFEVASTPKSYGSQLYAAEISKSSSSVVDTLVAAGAIRKAIAAFRYTGSPPASGFSINDRLNMHRGSETAERP